MASNYRTDIDVEEKIETSVKPNTKEMNDIKLSDTHLRVINRALEVYSRMRSGQIGMALDEAYDKFIDYDSRDLIEKMVCQLIINDKDLFSRGSSYSFNNPKMGDAKIAYEILATFRQYLAVKNNDGYFDYSTVHFSDPLKASEEPLPEIVNFVKYMDHLLTPEQSKKINQLHNKKKYKEAWEYIDSLKLDVPRGERVELVSGFNGVTMRIHKPRKEKRYL